MQKGESADDQMTSFLIANDDFCGSQEHINFDNDFTNNNNNNNNNNDTIYSDVSGCFNSNRDEFTDLLLVRSVYLFILFYLYKQILYNGIKHRKKFTQGYSEYYCRIASGFLRFNR